MNRTKIEWARNPDGSPGYTSNPASGCENHTPEGLCLGGLFPCYAWKLAHGRLKPLYLANDNFRPYAEKYDPMQLRDIAFYGKDPFYPRFWEERLNEMMSRYTQLQTCITFPPKRGIFVCDMGDLFGTGLQAWTRRVLDMIKWNGYDRFYLLTKQPQNLARWSPFPENCYVGVTATSFEPYGIAGIYLPNVQATVKFISFEPLLGRITDDQTQYNSEMMARDLKFAGISWLIIGACTGSWVDMANLCLRYGQLTLTLWGNKWTAQPPIEWVREIVEAADQAGVKVFLKDNLKPLLIPEDCSKPNYLTEDIFWASEKAQLRQEMPE